MTTLDHAEILAEAARQGQAAFEKHVKPRLRAEDDGKFVAVDIQTGNYEIDADDYAATERMLARVPADRILLLRVGHATTYRIGRWIVGGVS